MWYWIIQSACYNILWFLCITFPKYRHRKQLLFAFVLLSIQFYLLNKIIILDAIMMLLLFFGGILVGGLLILSKQFFYENKGYFPLWLTLIWASFTVYCYPLLWLYRQHFVLQGIIMFFAFIMVYYIAINQKAIYVQSQKITALLCAGIAYGMFFLGLSYLYTKVPIK